MVITERNEYTFDSLFSGKLQCVQHKQGYRFSIDAVLLGHFIHPKPGDQILDLCAGCGIVSLIIAYRWSDIFLAALEVQPALAELIRRNIKLNSLDGRLSVIEGDVNQIRDLLAPESYDVVVCNPPYRKAESGRRNIGKEQAVARHEVKADLPGIIKAVVYGLKNRGRASLVYPAERSTSLFAELRKHGLEPKRMQIIYSYPGSAGKLILVEAVKGGGEELTIMPPMYVYEEQGGKYTLEMAKLYEP